MKTWKCLWGAKTRYTYVATRRDRSDGNDDVDNDEDNNMTTTR